VVLGVLATLLLVLRVDEPVLRVVAELLDVRVELGVAVVRVLVERVAVERVVVALELFVLGVRATLLLVPRVEELVLRVAAVVVLPKVRLLFRFCVPDAADTRLLPPAAADERTAVPRTLLVPRISRAFTMPALRRSNERSG